MRRAAYWLVPLIAFAVALFIGIFLVKINPAIPKVNPIEKDHTVDNGGLKDKFGSWISRLSGDQEDEYFYPVNEVTLNLDMGDTPVATTVYRLSVKPKNSDELLRIKEVLKNSELPYDMDDEEENKILTVDSNDKAQLQSLVTKLKNYQITATLSPYTEEK
jgi:hypothetical protein